MNLKMRLALGFVMAGSLAHADITVNTTGSAAWYDWTRGGLSGGGTSGIFWDNNSADNGNNPDSCNVGFWLSAVGNPGNCANVSPVSNTGDPKNYTAGPEVDLPFLGTAGGASGSSFEFTPTATTTVTLKAAIAGGNNVNEFGYYTYDAGGNKVLTTLFTPPGFDGNPSNPGDTSSFTVSDTFGFYIKSAQGTFFSIDGLGCDARGICRNAFSLFSQDPSGIGGQAGSGKNLKSYWIGTEDRASNTDFDYNDFIVQITSAVPEPGFYGMLALGLGGLFFAVNRRREKNV